MKILNGNQDNLHIFVEGRLVYKYNFTKRKQCPKCGDIISDRSIKCKPCATDARKGRIVSEATKQKIRTRLKELHKQGKLLIQPKNQQLQAKSTERLKKIAKFKRGKTYEEIYGKEKARTIKKKISNSLKDNICYRNPKRGNQISKSRKNNPKIMGENSSNWKGGKSFEPYGLEFNKKLKEYIRKLYHYRCQQCFRHQDELGCKLSVHHIDFNKQNNNSQNLIPLCKVCHGQTTYDRNKWIDYFKEKIIKNEYTQDQKIILDFNEGIKYV